jgi:hypothetical protein
LSPQHAALTCSRLSTAARKVSSKAIAHTLKSVTHPFAGQQSKTWWKGRASAFACLRCDDDLVGWVGSCIYT